MIEEILKAVYPFFFWSGVIYWIMEIHASSKEFKRTLVVIAALATFITALLKI